MAGLKEARHEIRKSSEDVRARRAKRSPAKCGLDAQAILWVFAGYLVDNFFFRRAFDLFESQSSHKNGKCWGPEIVRVIGSAVARNTVGSRPVAGQ